MRVCRTAADLAGLGALDLVLVPEATDPLPAFLAERLLPPAPPAAGRRPPTARRCGVPAATTSWQPVGVMARCWLRRQPRRAP